MRSIRRGEVQISYRVGGSGPQTVVFLHGLAGHAGEWTQTAAALQPEFTTIAIDQRGDGALRSLPMADPSFGAYSAELRDCRSGS